MVRLPNLIQTLGLDGTKDLAQTSRAKVEPDGEGQRKVLQGRRLRSSQRPG